jgi:DNA invertase Pin-like site-specific DNA recombinase
LVISAGLKRDSIALNKHPARAIMSYVPISSEHPAIRVLLVEKTDPLYRNLKDWVTVDELEVEVHFPKEGVVLSRESRSSEKFMHGIKVLMAKNYVDNLSEETRKGMLEKAEQGIWPSFVPLGYRNVDGPDGKKIIAPDPDVAPIVSKLFDWYATGRLSLKEAAHKARDAGLVYRKSGAKVPVSTVHSILRSRFSLEGRTLEQPGGGPPVLQWMQSFDLTLFCGEAQRFRADAEKGGGPR